MNDNIDKNLDIENLEDSELEQVSGGKIIRIKNDEDINKLEQGICCQCDGQLKWVGGSDPVGKTYICVKCKRKYKCYLTVENRKLRWERRF